MHLGCIYFVRTYPLLQYSKGLKKRKRKKVGGGNNENTVHSVKKAKIKVKGGK